MIDPFTIDLSTVDPDTFDHNSFEESWFKDLIRLLRVSPLLSCFKEAVTEERNTDATPESVLIQTIILWAQRRRANSIQQAITQAKFRYPQACLAELVNPQERGLNVRQLKRIMDTNWRQEPYNIHLFAPTGAGKTYIACMIGVAACLAGYTVAYYRLDQLLDELARIDHTDTRYEKLVDKLINVDVLILDDFMTFGIDSRGQYDLSKIVMERDERLPFIIASQSTSAYWLESLPDRMGADTMIGRLSTGKRIDIGDFDIRRYLRQTTTDTDDHEPTIHGGHITN